jgi:hypothetical protein
MRETTANAGLLGRSELERCIGLSATSLSLRGGRGVGNRRTRRTERTGQPTPDFLSVLSAIFRGLLPLKRVFLPLSERVLQTGRIRLNPADEFLMSVCLR